MEKKTVQIRFGTFETNSSSTHSMVIVPDDGQKYYIEDNCLISEAEYIKSMIHFMEYHNEVLGTSFDDIEDFKDNCDKNFYNNNSYNYAETVEDWLDDEYLETDVTDYTTASGDKISILSKFGNDY